MAFESILNLKSPSGKTETYLHLLHQEDNFMLAAEVGNVERLEKYIGKKETDLQRKNYLGQNALHLAAVSGNEHAISLLIKAGVETYVKDHLGATPLSLCLFRRPSLKIAKLLFSHGAYLVPRVTQADTGLFLQFVMMCKPTDEEAKIMELLLEKGALINDPEAPGGRQALHFAAMSNNCKLIRILVDLGADLQITNHRNETPKDVASTFRCKEALKLLKRMEEMSDA